MHATNATPNAARGENSPSAESAPATTSAGIAGIGSPSCSSSTFAKTSTSPYCAMRRSMGGSERCDCRATSRAIAEALASGAAEGPAVLRRPLPGLLVDTPGPEDQRALAAHRLAATGTEHDAGADAYAAA